MDFATHMHRELNEQHCPAQTIAALTFTMFDDFVHGNWKGRRIRQGVIAAAAGAPSLNNAQISSDSHAQLSVHWNHLHTDLFVSSLV